MVRRRAPGHRSRGESPPPDGAPVVVNGWALYTWVEFAERWAALRGEVARLRAGRPPDVVRQHPATKTLAMVSTLVLREIPADPGAPAYRLGHALGSSHTHWRRAKFFRRFRLFFRYHSERRIIVYAWLNDEHTLRKAGARSDAYTVFSAMLARGTPPSDFEDLLRAAASLRAGDARE